MLKSGWRKRGDEWSGGVPGLEERGDEWAGGVPGLEERGDEWAGGVPGLCGEDACGVGSHQMEVLPAVNVRLNGRICKRSAGRHYRHSAINDIIHRALVAAHVPSRLEPSGLYRSDGKRPDGITTVPWKCGQLLVWDATCPDTYAPSYSTIAAQQAGAVGQQAEDKKAQKYKHLSSHHFFTPVAIETSGVYGPRTADFLKELGYRLRQVSGEASSFHYLAQRLSVAIQRGNSASVMGTMDGDGEEFFV
ncbi:hypothetical protein EMCRGX_G017546 [Ephydatia muelleri]